MCAMYSIGVSGMSFHCVPSSLYTRMYRWEILSDFSPMCAML